MSTLRGFQKHDFSSIGDRYFVLIFNNCQSLQRETIFMALAVPVQNTRNTVLILFKSIIYRRPCHAVHIRPPPYRVTFPYCVPVQQYVGFIYNYVVNAMTRIINKFISRMDQANQRRSTKRWNKSTWH